jgi:hypothetical protein
MDIGEAVTAMRAGRRLRRADWKAKGIWVALRPSELGPPVFCAKTSAEDMLPWQPTHADLLAEDWERVSGDER